MPALPQEATWKDRECVSQGNCDVSWLGVGMRTVPTSPSTITLGKPLNRSGPQFARP